MELMLRKTYVNLISQNLGPFLKEFSPETPPFSRACYPINLVRSCGSRLKRSNFVSHCQVKLLITIDSFGIVLRATA
jgi:hypothetical protein